MKEFEDATAGADLKLRGIRYQHAAVAPVIARTRQTDAETIRIEEEAAVAKRIVGAAEQPAAQRQASKMIRSGGNPQMDSAVANEFRAYHGEMMGGNAELLRALGDARREAASARGEAARMRAQMAHLSNSQ